MKEYRSNGKLLITGEYVVLDGALALAVPTKYGQSLTIENIESRKLIWKSYDELGAIWFEGEFSFHKSISCLSPENETSKRLLQILNAAKELNPIFLDSEKGYKISTHLDFPKNWGLGTSSTLINNIAQWANVDAFKLLQLTFGGSGYDIACAQNDNAITYQLKDKKPSVETVDFSPKFKNQLYFVYLNKKQNSRDGIAHYKSLKTDLKPVISEIDAITRQLILCESLNEFQELITQHETIISKLTKQDSVKSLYFNDFKGAIKSLGAWGGDFILVCSETDPTAYFRDKGFDTVIAYCDMVL